MHCHHIAFLSVLSAAFLVSVAAAILITPPWEDQYIKHTWGSVPENWVSLGIPPSGTTIDLYIALKPEHENALIDVLYEVSTPRHPKHVLLPFFTCTRTHMCHYSVQVRQTSV
jgi:hypothetical protein